MRREKGIGYNNSWLVSVTSECQTISTREQERMWKRERQRERENNSLMSCMNCRSFLSFKK